MVISYASPSYIVPFCIPRVPPEARNRAVDFVPRSLRVPHSAVLHIALRSAVAMSAAHSDIPTLIKKCDHHDADERYMAVNDISNLLQRDAITDSRQEEQIKTAILKRLQRDKSNDVQAKSVSCLSILVTRASPTTVADVVTTLTMHLVDRKGDVSLRDIYSIGLKTVIKEVSSLSPDVVTSSADALLRVGVSATKSDADASLQLECLDINADLLKKFGSLMSRDLHHRMLDDMLRLLADPKSPVRKRATACLGHLASSISDEQLETMVARLLASFKSASERSAEVTYIQTIGTISRVVGWRLGRHLDSIVPLLLGAMGSADDETSDDQVNDLRENCLQAFESVITRCPHEVTDYVGEIRDTAMNFLVFDPNYEYDNEDDGEDDFEDSDYDDEFQDDYSDDDDTSWKVRRAAVKVLEAIVKTRADLLEQFYSTCAPVIIERFKEREETVKLDLLSLFTTLVHATAVIAGAGDAGPRVVGSTTTSRSVGDLGPSVGAPPALVRQVSDEANALLALLGDLIASAGKVLRTAGVKSTKTKTAVWVLLKQVSQVVGSAIAKHVPSIVPLATLSLRDKHGPLRLEVLLCLRMMLDTCEPTAFHTDAETIVHLVVDCVSDDWYKTVAEALRVVGRVAAMLRPRDDSGDFDASSIDARPFVDPLFKAMLPKLSARDIDQEIKESAITAMGLFLAHMGDLLSPRQIEDVLPLFLERLRNEITRLAALKSLRFVAASHSAGRGSGLDLSSIIGEATTEMGTFLLQQSRPLKHAALECLTAFVAGHSDSMSRDMLAPALHESARMINEGDMQLSHQALRLASNVLAHQQGWADLLTDVRDAAVELSASSMLQGQALTSLLEFFEALSPEAAMAGMGETFDGLLRRLFKRVHSVGDGATRGSGTKHAVTNVARCAAVLTVNATPAARNTAVSQLFSDVASALSGSGDDEQAFLALTCVGEIGRRVDLTDAIGESVFTDLLAACDGGTEDVKSAAALAFGGVCVGNMDAGLPVLQSELESGRHSTYLLLSALREILSQHGDGFDVTPYGGTVMPILTSHANHGDEGVRNMTAECLGKLAGVSPEKIVSLLAEMARDADTNTRWTVATALKYAVVSPSTASYLADSAAQLLSGLTDEDLNVRRAALLSLNAVVHHRVQVVKPFLRGESKASGEESKGGSAEDVDMDGAGSFAGASIDEVGVFPVLYAAMELKLPREVDLGPFKHKIDDGLPLRKAAYACMDSILEYARERVNASAFMARLIAGLKDVDDVKMLCHQLVTKLCSWPVWQRHVLANLKGIVSGLHDAFKALDARSAAKKADASNDFIRSALRAVDAISRSPDAMGVLEFRGLVEGLQKRPAIAITMDTIRAERVGGSGGTAAAASIARGGAGGAGGAGFRK